MKKISIGNKALLPVPVVIVGTRSKENKNDFATYAWVGIINSEPPMIGVSIRKSRLTYKYVVESNHFSVNVPAPAIMEETDYCGIVSGNDINKEEKCNFNISYSKNANMPLIKECPINIECKVNQIIELPSHDFFISEVLETYIDEKLYKDERIDYDKIDSFIYMQRSYRKLGDNIGSPFKSGLNLKD